MFQALLALGLQTGSIYRIELPGGSLEIVYNGAGPAPDGVQFDAVSEIMYWTTMGASRRTPGVTGEAGLDFSARNGGVHAVGLDGAGRGDVIPAGSITTGKQLVLEGVRLLYWSDREGCRVSRAAIDGSGLVDLVVNTPGDDPMNQCVGVAVDRARGHLYWSQKGPSDGGRGRILRAGIEIPEGETAASRSDIEVLWDRLPEPIDLEVSGNQLYWTDRGAPPNGNTLNRAPIPAFGAVGEEPTILADGFGEAIGLAVDSDAAVAYVSALSGEIRSVPISGGPQRVLADIGEPLSGISGITKQAK